MKKKLIVTADIALIIITIIPVLLLLWDCINTAINGTIPWGGIYGTDYVEKIYGIEAFFYALTFDFVFLFVLFVLWAGLFFYTIAFTVFTVLYVKNPAMFSFKQQAP